MKKNIWERATVAALVLGTAGWLTGGCGNETQEVSTNTLIPFASPFASVIPAGSITLTGAQVPAGTQTISVRFTLPNGQTATTTGVQSAAGVISAPTPSGFTGTSAVQVTYQGTGGTLLGTQTTTANLVGNNQPVSAQLGTFVGPTPSPLPTITPTPPPAISPTPTPAPSVTPPPAPSPIAGLTGNIAITGNALVQTNNTTQLTATGNVSGTATNITNQVGWTTSNAAVANVSATGLVRGNSAGNATITATSGNSTGSFNVTVVAPPPPPPTDN